MALKRFGSASTAEESYSLPWLEEYIADSGDKEAVAAITFVTFSEKGAMVYTEVYKAHIKARRGLYKDLQEALPQFVSASKSLPMLFCSADNSKRPVLLQDDEKLSHRWFHSEGRYIQVAQVKEQQVPQARKNPLLECLEGDSDSAEPASASSPARASSGVVKERAGKTK